ncbi:MAG: excinuclease ABC subunit UvrC [Candidatus Omnitrophica bacterium]|nr:excinuclease ABC subunit UvrC [Candidatus Omnitrophota bacterium]MBU4479065.1 excinuclease ABC subunit UvrC [Candidatus Omnitrophota bacterium]MCG2703092.1 excinuclease ABC subunit UvrC [Candidatus Omnitrophota bacterium]
MELLETVKSLPDSPGVYLMKDSAGRIIYIGKASSLKKRVGSYFSRTGKPLKQTILAGKIAGIDYIPTGSQAEALILEAGLIKEHKPKYNVAIKDDKAYPLLKLTMNERFPRLRIVRRKKSGRARYFGPYTSAKLLRQALNFMRHIFPLRNCNIMPRTLCLNYHLKQCLGPCALKCSAQEYRQVVENLHLFLEGKKSDLIGKLSSQMQAASAVRDYERALRIRGQIEALSSVSAASERYKPADQIAELQVVLRLKHAPTVIEGYDISSISGTEAVGSMVRFRGGYPIKQEYRRFKIKTVKGIDDYAMMEEIIERRFCGSLRDWLTLPDLLLIDGGKGHLQCVLRKLEKIGIPLAAISIAKKFEHIYVPWQEQPLALPARSKALRLLMRIRDEAHRFALSYHHVLRKKHMLLSELDQIPGVGKKRRKILMDAWETIMKFKRLTVKQMKGIRGIDERTAKNIIEYWQKY